MDPACRLDHRAVQSGRRRFALATNVGRGPRILYGAMVQHKTRIACGTRSGWICVVQEEGRRVIPVMPTAKLIPMLPTNVMPGDGTGAPGSRQHPPGQQAARSRTNVHAETRDRADVICRAHASVIDKTAAHPPAGADERSNARRQRALQQTHLDARLRSCLGSIGQKDERKAGCGTGEGSGHDRLHANWRSVCGVSPLNPTRLGWPVLNVGIGLVAGARDLTVGI
jgi:hypothetical protein